MRLNLDKCLFCQTEIEYLGKKLSAAGVQPSSEKVKAVRNMLKPQNQEDLRRAFGLVSYLGTFVPNISKATQELRLLFRDGSEWKWSVEADKKWNCVVQYLTSEPVLKFYDPNR